ncbi:MAG: DUF4424 family protein [Cytophaga sp.]|nr:DUF4424 family protein [Undibacterium sp.]
MKYLYVAALLMWAQFSIALANDGVAALSAGGISLGKTDAVAMKKEVLNVSYDKISVAYEFLNESQTDVEETIFFPLPEYTADYHGSREYSGQPSHFVVEANGKAVNYKTIVIAKMDGDDITKELKQLGLSEEQIAYYPSFSLFGEKVKPLTPKQRKYFKERGFLAQIGGDDAWIPTWSVAIQYVWKQKFPVGQVVKVNHQYRPFVSYGPSESTLGESFNQYFCGDKNFLKSWHKLAAERNNQVEANTVSYILKTGNTWKNGIEDFTMNLVKKNPAELISLCFSGEFKKINPTTLQIHLTNFKPQQDLLVYFGNIENSSGDPGLKPRLNH